MFRSSKEVKHQCETRPAPWMRSCRDEVEVVLIEKGPGTPSKPRAGYQPLAHLCSQYVDFDTSQKPLTMRDAD